MKGIFLALASISVLLACSKSSSRTGESQLVGVWELRQSIGGVAGTINYAPNSGYGLSFDNKGNYRILCPANANCLPGGTYTLEASATKGDWLLRRTYQVNSSSRTETDSIRFESNKLIILPQQTCCDYPTFIYERPLKD